MTEDRILQRGLTKAKLTEVTDAVRAFCVIYHTSLMYHVEHAVFQSAVEERMPVVNNAIKGLPALTLKFSDSQIRCADLPLEPGSGVFQRVAQAFEKIGIRNLTFLPGIDAQEMMRLIALIGGEAEAIRTQGLAAVLKRGRFRFVDACETFRETSAQSGSVNVSEESSARGGSSQAWDISDPMEVAGALDSVVAEEAEENLEPKRSFRYFITGILGAMGRREADPEEAAEIISMEFEHRLEERVEIVRRDSEKKIRRLETVKELILAELERLSIAAVIIDTELQVLAANALAGKLLGSMQAVAPGSPLEQFIRSGHENQVITIAGKPLTARLITVSSSGSGTDVMLITLEKQQNAF